ncbi:MAG: hypothetical protein NTU89_03615 [Candidatus Dependentiae bacterium]|nr:hypothetical protein [Candidatus Dependentiae bacterium]
MKKIFLKLNNVLAGYWIIEDAGSRNFELYNLYLALDPIEDGQVQVTDYNGTVLIWSLDSFKESAQIEFQTDKEKHDFDRSYYKYYDKRWKEMPKIEVTSKDYQDLKVKWTKIIEEKPEYVIFSLDDSGPIHTVDVVGKNELSEQDIIDSKQEHEKFLRYEKAINLYRNSLVDYSDVWRSSADDEYDSDIEKHYNKKSTGWIKTIKRKLGF